MVVKALKRSDCGTIDGHSIDEVVETLAQEFHAVDADGNGLMNFLEFKCFAGRQIDLLMRAFGLTRCCSKVSEQVKRTSFYAMEELGIATDSDRKEMGKNDYHGSDFDIKREMDEMDSVLRRMSDRRKRRGSVSKSPKKPDSPIKRRPQSASRRPVTKGATWTPVKRPETSMGRYR